MKTMEIEVPQEISHKWQEIVNLLAEIMRVPAALIMKVEPPEITVFVASESVGNPYERGARAGLNSGLYGETVMKTRQMLRVTNALEDEAWQANPDIKLGMISYLGFPLAWPNGDIFGIICVLDNKQNAYSELYRRLLQQFGDVVEADLQSLLERQRVEAMLAEERNLLHTLIYTLPDQVYAKDTQSRFVLANGATLHNLGATTLDEALGKTDFDFHPLELAAQYYANEQALIQSGQSLINKEESNVDDETGLREWVIATKVPLRDSQGRIVGLVGVNRDITERKQAEEELRKYRDHLEELVEARTAELTGANEQLQREIAERQQVDERLRESEEKYRSLYTNTPVMMHSIDQNGRLTSVSNFWLESLGYERAEVIGRKSLEFLTSESQKYAQEVVLPEFFRMGMCKNVPYQFIKKNGEIMDVLLSAIAEKDAAGNIARSLAVLIDVTDRKQAEEALRLSEERYRALYRDNPSMFFTLDAAGVVLAVNQFGASQLGYTINELEGQPVLKVFYEADQPAVADQLKICLQHPWQIYQWQFRKIRKDGSLLWVEEFVRAVSGPSDAFNVLVVCHDITERKRVEEALREEEERFRYLALATHDAIYDWNIRTNTVWRNEAYQALCSPNKPIGTDGTWWKQQIHPDDRQWVEESIGHAFREGSPSWSDEYRLFRFDGNYANVIDRGYILYDHAGLPIRMIGAITDITERKQAEVEREALIAELETKNAELERFIYTVSHDLKSPLITIHGFLGYVEQAALIGDINQVKADIARITNAVIKMKQLLDELLELSRIGRLINPPQVVPLGDLAREAVEMVAGRLAERNIEVQIAPDLPAVYGDRMRLREVLENLLDNAVKYIGNQSQPCVEIGARYNSAEPIFYVRDNGVGIDPRYHQKVFGLFEKLDQQAEGTGVGLAIVKRIVEVHGGRIWVESAGAGHGSTFCFTLPDSRQMEK
jgi:PAS domain S-box-containing protein